MALVDTILSEPALPWAILCSSESKQMFNIRDKYYSFNITVRFWFRIERLCGWFDSPGCNAYIARGRRIISQLLMSA
ncbi:hypothetical protein PoB_004795600 [Plakobranchus ocellatus]|uniref:Uncharacterized protein n=1 Tax=Plakobranchus ocellatus TaxID=259542 RepID=A0AAV4BQW6_9GAST|nr:hypothetical protein PoB_004795600 [Plakobranchus ocellatus]